MTPSPQAVRVRRLVGRVVRRAIRPLRLAAPSTPAPPAAPSTPAPPAAPSTPTTKNTETAAEVQRAVAGITAKNTERSGAARVARPEGVWSGTPLTHIRALVLADDRLAGLLDPEWHQTRPVPDSRDGECTDPTSGVHDLVLVQLAADGVAAHGDGVTDLVVAALDAGTPVLVWVSATPPQTPSWLTRASAVLVSDKAAALSLEGRGVTVTRVHPFVQPLTQGPAGRDPFLARRRRQVGVVVDSGAGIEPGLLSEIYAPAIQRMQRRELVMLGVQDEGAELVLPDGLPDRIQAVGSWAQIGGTLGTVGALMDLGGSTPWADWTTMAAAAHALPLIGVEGAGGALPPEVAALVPRVKTAFDLRVGLGARMRQPELGRREGHLLLRSVMRSHTAGHRVRDLAAHAGLALPTVPRSVSAVVPTNRTHELNNVFANLGRQEDVEVELVLVLHGLDSDHADLKARAAAAGVDRLVLVNADASLTLGACMNLGVDASSGHYVAKMDDDNYYGAQFLADLVDSFGYSGAGITGKWCHYVWLTSSRATVLRFPEHEHRFGNRVQGGSMLFDGDLVRSLRFSDIPRRVDSDILDRAEADGVPIYSADPWNYVSVRGTDRHSHTWDVSDDVFLTDTGDLRFFGDPREHVSI
ncbi:glycosyltransferase [Janibacter melonis]|uniref:glycosyltransferase n=1 Tax=Janibacter melonis TaxID=262209 RepID=UPI00204333B6|nr:glycosyltransferase [Janibacter melonis]MCM3553716.1 glycosyltransferase [Janibacter melonis]